MDWTSCVGSVLVGGGWVEERGKGEGAYDWLYMDAFELLDFDAGLFVFFWSV